MPGGHGSEDSAGPGSRGWTSASETSAASARRPLRRRHPRRCSQALVAVAVFTVAGPGATPRRCRPPPRRPRPRRRSRRHRSPWPRRSPLWIRSCISCPGVTCQAGTRCSAEDFDEGDVPVGGFPGPRTPAKWSAGYMDGTPDTAGQRGAKSGYYPSKVLSVKNGMLDWYLHTENGVPWGPRPRRKSRTTAPTRTGTTASCTGEFRTVQGRFPARFQDGMAPVAGQRGLAARRRDRLPGRRPFHERSTAPCTRWGTTPTRPTSLFPTPRSRLARGHHGVEPGQGRVFLDGRSLGAGTFPTPTSPCTTFCRPSPACSDCPSPETAGHVYLDWIAIWERSSGVRLGPASSARPFLVGYFRSMSKLSVKV